MTLRLTALALVAGLSGCMWEGRPDGAEAVHSASDGYYGEYGPQATPLGGDLVEAEVIEPLDGSAGTVGDGVAAPIPTPQPVPTTGPSDTTTEVEEALTPGTER
ncbi:hypothetical protein [Rubrivirga sp. IMCC45206]|uniref:hypothetical protein n=1 Tax=Rubrivirga sp. IMCC45206 TaxID=3391614 RepID=UPI00398FAE65